SPEEVLSKAVGPYGDVLLGVPNLASGLYESMDRMSTGKEFSPTEISIKTMRTILMFERAIPMRGDMQKLLREYEKDIKAEKRRKSKPAGDIILNMENSGTEFDVPLTE